jgi:hypothetical protein
MPRPIVITATAVKAGLFKSDRIPKRMSLISESILSNFELRD